MPGKNLIFILFSLYLTQASLAQGLSCHEVFTEVKATSQYEFKNLSTILQNSVKESMNPYTLAYDVRGKLSESNFKNEIQSLAEILAGPLTQYSKLTKLNDWVKSEAHALFLYDILHQAGLSQFKTELNYLLSESVYFIEANPIRGPPGTQGAQSLVTYSFEKEGNSADITLFYRLPQYSEAEWLNKSDDARFKIIQQYPIPMKTFVSAEKMAPTEFKPSFVGGYSNEMNGFHLKGYGWEIAHKKYEISRDKIIRQIHEIAKIFKETHSIHMHIVFEIPKKYPKFENLTYWYKQLNDYLYLRGLEEGLHGNSLTGVANVAKDLSFRERIKNLFKSLYSSGRTLVESQFRVGKYSSKYFSAGLRSGMYGKASSDDQMKIGIELRDTTRKIENLDLYSKTVAEAVAQRIWEKSDVKEIKLKNFRLTDSIAAAEKELANIVSPEMARLFSKAEPTVHFGILKYHPGQGL